MLSTLGVNEPRAVSHQIQASPRWVKMPRHKKLRGRKSRPAAGSGLAFNLFLVALQESNLPFNEPA